MDDLEQDDPQSQELDPEKLKDLLGPMVASLPPVPTGNAPASTGNPPLNIPGLEPSPATPDPSGLGMGRLSPPSPRPAPAPAMSPRVTDRVMTAPLPAQRPSLGSRILQSASGAAPRMPQPIPKPVANKVPDVSAPTFDQVMNGAQAPMPAAITSNLPSAPAPASSSVLPAASPATPPAVTAGLDDKLPPPPPGPNVGDLMRQRAELGKPLDRRAVDPKTGKPLYRMSIGQRILSAAGDALMNFATRGRSPVSYIGPGATNQRYNTDEAAREANLKNVDTQISEQEKLGEENRQLYEAATQGAYRQGQIEKAQGMAAKYENAVDPQTIQQDDQGNWSGTTYGGERKSVGEPAWSQKITAQENKEKTKLDNPTNEIELAQAYQMAVLKGDKQKAAIYKGTLDQLKALKAAGKDTSAADLGKYLQVSEFRMKEKDSVDKEKEAERTRRYKEIEANPLVKYDQAKVTQMKQQVDQGLESKYAPKYDEIQTKSDEMLGLTKTGAKLKNQPAPTQPAAPGAQPPPKPTTPAPAGKVWVYDKKTKQRGTIPQSQLAAATQGANAQYSTW